MRYVREVKPKLDIFREHTFANFRKTLDAEMKRLRTLGHGTHVKQAEPVSDAEKDSLWSKGKLGSQTPQSLLDTVVFLYRLYFALRSGKEDRNLSTDQLELVEQPDSVPHLIYTENVSKNNPGELYIRKIKPKVVIHHVNVQNPARCCVTFYKAYTAHRPKAENMQQNAFYLAPIRSPKSHVWYSTSPVGYHTLSNTVTRLCKSASVDGFKTNHSLRETAATRLVSEGINEQLIMMPTGHRSIDGVPYARTRESQKASSKHYRVYLTVMSFNHRKKSKK